MHSKGASEPALHAVRQQYPVYRKAPAEISPVDEDRVVLLDPARLCTFCGAGMEQAKVVHIQDSQYEYACLDCATLA